MTNDMTPFGGGDKLTMSSIEIAELTEKEHRNVMRDIRTMLDGLGGGVLSFEHTHVNPQNGQSYPIFRLPKRETLILVSGYSVELRAKIVDRWMELEAKEQSNVTFLVPKSLPEALRLAADLADKVEQQKAQIVEMAPKATFHDRVSQAINCHTFQEVAKILGSGQNRLFKWAREFGMLMANNQPYQRFVDEGYFRVIEKQYNDPRGESHTYTRTLITGKGLAYIQKRFDGTPSAA